MTQLSSLAQWTADSQKWDRSSLLVQPEPAVDVLAREHIRSGALSAEMKELAPLPRESAAASAKYLPIMNALF